MLIYRSILAILVFTATLMMLVPAWSHTRWKPDGVVPPRPDSQGNYPSDLKEGPCGGLPRSGTAVRFEPGVTVEVEFESTIYHQGHFRIAFSEAGDIGFEERILADNIRDYADQSDRRHTIILPDIECNDCTLQLIQVMQDRTPPTNYYSCADIQLVRDDLVENDTVAPMPVNAVLALPGDGELQLTWSNPSDADFAGVLVLESSDPAVRRPQFGDSYNLLDQLGDATVVHTGSAAAVRLGDRVNGQSYHYQFYAYDEVYNYSTVATAQAQPTATEENIRPHVSIAVEQNQLSGMDINISDGRVTAQANVSDLNTADNHTYDWSQSDVRLVNQSTDPNQYVFDPHDLAPGDYDLAVAVTDDGAPPLSAQAVVTLKVTDVDPRQQGGSISFLMLLTWFLLPLIKKRKAG